MIYSAINYMGSKRRLLAQIKPLLPTNINTFYDLFAGSLIVDLNTEAQKYVANDLNTEMINLFSFLKELDNYQITTLMTQARTLANQDIFYKTRSNYNNNHNSRDLYLLITSSFNGIPRWNRKGDYNMPFANTRRLHSSYYENKERKLRACIGQLQNMNIEMTSKPYEQVIDLSQLHKNDFVYLDPPYYGTDATYNRQSGWGEKQEKQVYKYLERLMDKGVHFAYSNVLTHRGFTNPFLQKFINQHSNEINVHHLDMSYKNSTYHTKAGKSDEILLTNY